jgi:hypothetical protein
MSRPFEWFIDKFEFFFLEVGRISMLISVFPGFLGIES